MKQVVGILLVALVFLSGSSVRANDVNGDGHTDYMENAGFSCTWADASFPGLRITQGPACGKIPSVAYECTGVMVCSHDRLAKPRIGITACPFDAVEKKFSEGETKGKCSDLGSPHTCMAIREKEKEARGGEEVSRYYIKENEKDAVEFIVSMRAYVAKKKKEAQDAALAASTTRSSNATSHTSTGRQRPYTTTPQDKKK